MSELTPDTGYNRRQFGKLVFLAGVAMVAESVLPECDDGGASEPQDTRVLDWIDMLPDHLKTGPDSARALAAVRSIQEMLAGTVGRLSKLALEFSATGRDAAGQDVLEVAEGPTNSWSGRTICGSDAVGNKLSVTFALGSGGMLKHRPTSARLDFAGKQLSYALFNAYTQTDEQGIDRTTWVYDGIDGAGNRVIIGNAISSLGEAEQLQRAVAAQLDQLIPPTDLS